jgi:ADP-heptose:LPS heptosyltransferase
MEPNGHPWINPVGGKGDMLLLSSVRKKVVDAYPDRRYNLIRRTGYQELFTTHPAIATIGYLPAGASPLSMGYWGMEPLVPPAGRPIQVLARAFGLKTPVNEDLWIPDEIADDPVLYASIPWKRKNVVIAPWSASVKKSMPASVWDVLATHAEKDDIQLIQVGTKLDPPVSGATNLLGLTDIRQAVALLRKVDAVVTVDNFIMHASHLAGTPAVVAWGPTDHLVYGYPEQVHLQMEPCPGHLEHCIGPVKDQTTYPDPCPKGVDHCLDKVDPELLYEELRRVLAR